MWWFFLFIYQDVTAVGKAAGGYDTKRTTNTDIIDISGW